MCTTPNLSSEFTKGLSRVKPTLMQRKVARDESTSHPSTAMQPVKKTTTGEELPNSPYTMGKDRKTPPKLIGQRPTPVTFWPIHQSHTTPKRTANHHRYLCEQRRALENYVNTEIPMSAKDRSYIAAVKKGDYDDIDKVCLKAVETGDNYPGLLIDVIA